MENPSQKRKVEDVEESAPELNLQVQLLSTDAKLPTRGSAMAAGLDIYSSEFAVVHARQRCAISTGICVAVPEGHYGRIAPRSGLALKNGIDVFAGVIDRDYSGEIKVILYNSSDKDFEIQKGDRIAQLILEKISIVPVVQVDSLAKTERGDKGFGSTGK